MKEKEKELFKCLCSFKADEFDKDLLKYATPAVLGHLFLIVCKLLRMEH